jgi:hypothetical protein
MTREESNKYIESLKAHMEEDALSKIEPLNMEDVAIIGCLIQTYNFIEYNLRRSIEIFAHTGLITRPKKKNPHSSELVELVKSGVGAIAQDADSKEIICKTLDDIELHRDIRNHFAHWAAKRIKGHDALYLMSLDHMDATRRVGTKVDHNISVFAIFNLAVIRGLIKHIAEQEQWLAELTAKWHVKYVLPSSS